MGAQWKAKGKELAANAKGKLFGRLAKDIMIAARSGADPASNSRLRLVVEQARKVSMPKDTLDRAIKKGAGLTGEAVNFEHVIYEGFAPHQVPVMVECLTDNLNRTAPEMRVLFRKGQLGTSGSVSWDFDHVGIAQGFVSAATHARAHRAQAVGQRRRARSAAGIACAATGVGFLKNCAHGVPRLNVGDSVYRCLANTAQVWCGSGAQLFIFWVVQRLGMHGGAAHRAQHIDLQLGTGRSFIGFDIGQGHALL